MRVCICFYSDVLVGRLYSEEGCRGPDLPLSTFLGQKVSVVDQLLCYRLWRVGAMLSLVGACGGMSLSTLESYVNYLTFIDFFFSLTLTNIFSFSFFFSDFYRFIDKFVYCLIDFFS